MIIFIVYFLWSVLFAPSAPRNASKIIYIAFDALCVLSMQCVCVKSTHASHTHSTHSRCYASQCNANTHLKFYTLLNVRLYTKVKHSASSLLSIAQWTEYIFCLAQELYNAVAAVVPRNHPLAPHITTRTLTAAKSRLTVYYCCTMCVSFVWSSVIVFNFITNKFLLPTMLWWTLARHSVGCEGTRWGTDIVFRLLIKT